MYFFDAKDEAHLDEVLRGKLYLADTLIKDIDEAFKDVSSKNLRSIKSAIFDIAVLDRVLSRLGFNAKLKGELRKVRNSLAHIDERMDEFDFKPIKIEGPEVKQKTSGDQFSSSVTLNFQGAVNSAVLGVPVSGGHRAEIKAVSLYGMIDDNFMWVDKNGVQQSTKIETLKEEYEELRDSLKNDLPRA